MIKNFFDAAQNIFSVLRPEAEEDLVVGFDEPDSACRTTWRRSFVSARELERSVGGDSQNLYTIRLANSQKQKKSAKELIGKMYSHRNYKSDNLLPESSRLTTFVACDGSGRLIGTVTVGLDSPEGLFADDVYRDEVTSLRLKRGKVCEFTCLAVLPEIRSKRVLGGLFHVAMLYASRVFGHSGVVFEVTPRHGRFYEKMLGMNRIASGRICKRVNTTSVLIYSDFSHIDEQVEKVHRKSVGEDGSRFNRDRSLYQHFFNGFEEAAILRRFAELLKKEESSLQSVSSFSSLSAVPLVTSN